RLSRGATASTQIAVVTFLGRTPNGLFNDRLTHTRLLLPLPPARPVGERFRLFLLRCCQPKQVLARQLVRLKLNLTPRSSPRKRRPYWRQGSLRQKMRTRINHNLKRPHTKPRPKHKGHLSRERQRKLSRAIRSRPRERRQKNEGRLAERPTRLP